MSRKINKLYEIPLNIFAIGLLGFALFYWTRMINQNLWEVLEMRIIIMVLTIGAVCCFSLARILHNQAEILKHLTNIAKKRG